MILVGLFLSYTKTGKAMRAVRDSSELASVSGINSDYIITIDVDFFKYVGWIYRQLSKVLLTTCSMEYGISYSSFSIFAGSILGGIGTSFGAMFGGFYHWYMLVQVSVLGLSFMDGHTEAKNAVALGSNDNVFLLFRPQGIFGQARSGFLEHVCQICCSS